MSDRAIAAEIGVSDKTVTKARHSTADLSAVEKRTGKDGKKRAAPRKRNIANPPEKEAKAPASLACAAAGSGWRMGRWPRKAIRRAS